MRSHDEPTDSPVGCRGSVCPTSRLRGGLARCRPRVSGLREPPLGQPRPRGTPTRDIREARGRPSTAEDKAAGAEARPGLARRSPARNRSETGPKAGKEPGGQLNATGITPPALSEAGAGSRERPRGAVPSLRPPRAARGRLRGGNSRWEQRRCHADPFSTHPRERNGRTAFRLFFPAEPGDILPRISHRGGGFLGEKGDAGGEARPK